MVGMSARIVHETMLARDLPPEWRAAGNFRPETRVVVHIEPEDPELVAAAGLIEVMTIIGRRAQERGLTEEKLQDILRDGD